MYGRQEEHLKKRNPLSDFTWLRPQLPRFEEEGKSYLTVAIGCTGGRHRSVCVAERLATWFAAEGRRAELRHREIGESGPA